MTLNIGQLLTAYMNVASSSTSCHQYVAMCFYETN